MCMNFNNKHYLQISIQLLILQKYLFSNKVSYIKLRDYATLIITITYVLNTTLHNFLILLTVILKLFFQILKLNILTKAT